MKSKRSDIQIPFIFRPFVNTNNPENPYGTRKQNYLTMVVGSICFTTFLLGFIGALLAYMSPITRNGISTNATVIQFVASGEFNSCRRSKVTYQFEVITDNGTTLYTGSDTPEGCLSPGEQITITYVANDPDKSIIGLPVNQLEDAPFVLTGIGSFVLLGTYLFAAGFTLQKRARQLKAKNNYPPINTD